VSSDGAPLDEQAAIQTNCKGSVRTETYTDSRGNFSFDFTNAQAQTLSTVATASDSSPDVTGDPMRRSAGRDPRDCEITAVLAGFGSETIFLASKNADFGRLDVGHLVVHRLARVEGATVSAKPVPEQARKDYFKGLEEKRNGKLDAAEQKFQKATQEYPEYAAAWLELGRIQKARNDTTAARASFQQSIKAEPAALAPYQELVQMAARDKQWQEVADTTDRMLKIEPKGYPEFWFYNSVSKYNLGNIPAAEASALEGVKIDGGHRVPKLEYILGVIQSQKGDQASAAEHLHNYLKLAPETPEAADAQKRLVDLDKGAAVAKNPSGS
jgi:tetratricopeptide (TPR) repeat protein